MSVRRTASMALAVTLLAAAALVATPRPAEAADTIVSENFDSFAAGWAASHWSTSGGLAVSDRDSASFASQLSNTFDTSGYQNLTVSFTYNVSGLAPGDLVVMSYGAGTPHTGWSMTSATEGSGVATFALDPDTDDASSLLIQFGTNTSNSPVMPTITLDDFTISGDAIPVDTTDPTIVSYPDYAGAVVASVGQVFAVTAFDDVTAASNLDVEFRFERDVVPALSTVSYPTYDAGLSQWRSTVDVTAFESSLLLSPGDTFTWTITVSDAAGNTSTATVPGIYYGSFTPTLPFFVTAPLGPYTVGTPVSPVAINTRGTSAITLSATGVPDGMAFEADPTSTFRGYLSGTPTTGGPYDMVVTATNAAGSTDQTYTIVINQPASLEPATLPSGVEGIAYDATIVASGYPAPSLSLTFGALPAGLALDATSGQITGTPDPGSAGFYPFDVTASSPAGSWTLAYSITIAATPVSPSIPTMLVPDALLGSPYSTFITATGAPTPTLSLVAGALPSGLSFDPATGTVSGTPTEDGLYSFTIRAENGVNPATARAFTLVVNSAPDIYLPIMPNARLNEPFQGFVFATGYPQPTLSVTTGVLPAGLSIDQASQSIVGTPTIPGLYTFDVTATNAYGSDVQTYTMYVTLDPQFGGTPTQGNVGSYYSFDPAAFAVPWASVSLVAGDIPPGLGIDGAGAIEGTPTQEGSWTFTLEADNYLAVAQREFTIVINPAPFGATLTTTALANGEMGRPYSQTLAATGYPAPTFAVTAGALPGGLTLDPATGEISGIPTASGTFSLYVTADNGIDQPSGRELTLVIAPMVPVFADDEELAFTGANPLPLSGLAAALIIMGVGALTFRARRP